MAVTIPTPNKDPVPSADINNVVFAGAKIDEFTASRNHYYYDRLGVRRFTISGIVNDYLLTKVDFQDQMNEFFLSNGFSFIDDYDKGPITFNNHHEISFFDGAFFRLKPSVSTPYTTSGNDENSFINDKENFYLIGDLVFKNEFMKQVPVSVSSSMTSRSMYDIAPSVIDTWGICGITFGGEKNLGALYIDEKGRIKTRSSINGLDSGSGLMFATVENYGTQQGKYPDKVLRMPSDGLESDNTSPSLIFTYNADGSPRILAVNPRMYGQYAWPESGTGFDGSLLVSGVGNIYRELLWSDNARSTVFGSYEPKTIYRNETTTVQYLPLVTWDMSGSTPWGGDLEFTLTTSKTNTYATTSLKVKANLQLTSGKTLANLTQADWSRIIESYFDGPYNMLRSTDTDGAYYDVVGLGVVYNSKANTVTLYLTLPTGGSQSGIYMTPVLVGNSSKMTITPSATRLTSKPSGLIFLSNSMVWTGANSGRSNDGSIVASDIHARVSNDTNWSSTRPDILYDGYVNAGNGTVRCAFDETIKITRTGTGTYQISGMSSAWNSWKVRPPKDQSGNDLAIVEVSGSGTTLTINVYAIVYTVSGTSATRGKGALIDIPSTSWVDINGVN